MNNQQDIMSVCLAVVRGMLTPEQAREAILSRMTPVPVQEILRLQPELTREAAQLIALPPDERDECLELFKDLYSQAPSEVVLREDGDLAQLLIQQRLVSSPQAEECLAIQRELKGKGVHPLPRLGELLVKKGFLIPGGPDPAASRLPAAQISSAPPLRANPQTPAPVLEALRNPDNQFGRYVRTTLLGEGGAGEVWKAWDQELERWVALKFLRFENTLELARLKREAQTAASLSHPGIARVFEIAEAQGRTFLAFEFIEGQTLETYPRHDHRKLVSLLRDAALAVHYAHGKGVIHRDLKPGNIMVDASDRAFVMDFGLARQIESQKSVTGLILGTPAYMPPEQATGGAVEVRSDVYSLGATLYELLGNVPPFRGTHVFDTLDQVVTREPEPLVHVASDLRTIVSKCLMKEVSGRYSTAANLAEDLRRWMEGEPIVAHPPSLLYRLRKRARKWRAVLVVAFCGVVTASGIAGLVIPRWLRADRAESLKELELTAEKDQRARADQGLALARPHLDEGRRLVARLDRLLTTESWTQKEVQSLVDQAQREFDRVLAIDPKHPDALLEKARVFGYAHDRVAALDYCTKAIESDQ
ncbi:MAG TPA: protein kinase, partial [Planctomycetota bacterium]|nr:protein kinase [Planctomycetota bacterium]